MTIKKHLQGLDECLYCGDCLSYYSEAAKVEHICNDLGCEQLPDEPDWELVESSFGSEMAAMWRDEQGAPE